MNKELIAKQLLSEWIDKQGHDKCWYYPDIFNELCKLFDVHQTLQSNLPNLKEFQNGCCKYQEEIYRILKNDKRSEKI